MYKDKANWSDFKPILIQSILFLVFLNLLYFLFFFNRSYNEFSIQTKLSTSSPTKVWYVYKNNFSEERFFSERKTLMPNKQGQLDFTIKSDKKIDYIGLYWVADKKGASINIDSYNYIIGDDIYNATKSMNIINYTSKGSLINSDNNRVTVKSTHKTNWIMLGSIVSLNEKRDYKKHTLIPFWWNILLMLLIVLTQFFCPVNGFLEILKNVKLSLSNIMKWLFYVWVFMMPFWIIISHTLLAIIVLLILVETYKNKNYNVLLNALKNNKAFIMYYVWVIISSLISSTSSQVEFSISYYIYFLLLPIVFSLITRKDLLWCFYYLERGILIYFLLLFIFTLNNYTIVRSEYTLVKFFELNLQMFWHTSYISAFILLFFIKKVKQPFLKHQTSILFYLVALAFMYLINARLAFVVGGLLIAFRILLQIKNKIYKITFLTGTLVVSVLLVVFFLFREANKSVVAQNSQGDLNSIDARISIWEGGLKAVSDNFVVGVGSKNTVDVIANAIDSKSSTKYRGYNAHNQFIETFLGHGFIAFMLLLFILYSLYKKGDIYGKSFVLVCTILFMVESYFLRQAGIIFFTFWYCYFLKFKTASNVTFK